MIGAKEQQPVEECVYQLAIPRTCSGLTVFASTSVILWRGGHRFCLWGKSIRDVGASLSGSEPQLLLLTLPLKVLTNFDKSRKDGLQVE